jgi:hypothetical protein
MEKKLINNSEKNSTVKYPPTSLSLENRNRENEMVSKYEAIKIKMQTADLAIYTIYVYLRISSAIKVKFTISFFIIFNPESSSRDVEMNGQRRICPNRSS